jgi:hypothetical protein
MISGSVRIISTTSLGWRKAKGLILSRPRMISALVVYVGAVQDLGVLRALGFVQVLENPAVHPPLDFWEPSFVLSLP